MEYLSLGQPCRNFCIFATEAFVDPKDDKKKFALSSFVAGGTGVLVFIDIQTGEGERIEIPADQGAWAIYCWNNERLLVGTCSHYGYLHALDLKTRNWMPSLQDPNEKYFWNLVEGSDGRIYGGTWPGGVLLRYDPSTHTLENMGRMSDETGNQYTRPLFNGAPGKIFLTSGYKRTHMVCWDIESEKATYFGENGYKVKHATETFVCGIDDATQTLYFYDPYTLEPMEDPIDSITLDVSNIKNESVKDWLKSFEKSGAHGGPNVYRPKWAPDEPMCRVTGQSYETVYPNGEVKTARIPAEPPPTSILTIAYDKKGRIWGSSGLGQTIFHYDVKTGEYENTIEVADAGGEVYGICPIEDRIYLTSYCGGEHGVYYPDRAWEKGINPRTFKALSPEYIRPHAKSVVDADGNIWTGWSANYGTYGGAITKINTASDTVDVYEAPAADQAIESISAGKDHIFFSTNGGGNGLPHRDIDVILGKMDYQGRVVWTRSYEPPNRIGAMLVMGQKLFVRIGSDLHVLDTKTMQSTATVVFPDDNPKISVTHLLAYDEQTLVAFCAGKAYFVNADTLLIQKEEDVKGAVHTAAVDEQGNIYFAKGNELFMLANR